MHYPNTGLGGTEEKARETSLRIDKGWTTLLPIATSGELAMKVWRHSQHFCNLSDKRTVIFHFKFSNFFFS
jgi:hypothetical protein